MDNRLIILCPLYTEGVGTRAAVREPGKEPGASAEMRDAERNKVAKEPEALPGKAAIVTVGPVP